MALIPYIMLCSSMILSNKPLCNFKQWQYRHIFKAKKTWRGRQMVILVLWGLKRLKYCMWQKSCSQQLKSSVKLKGPDCVLSVSCVPGACSLNPPWTWRSPDSWQRSVCLAPPSRCSKSPGFPPAGSSLLSGRSRCRGPVSRNHRCPPCTRGRPRCPPRRSWRDNSVWYGVMR